MMISLIAFQLPSSHECGKMKKIYSYPIKRLKSLSSVYSSISTFHQRPLSNPIPYRDDIFSADIPFADGPKIVFPKRKSL